MSQRLARSLVFFSSASVLVIELLAARILAPYIGVSLETFTGIIGVVLAGIAVGAWGGGRAADRGDPGRLIGPLLVSGGLLAMAAPLIVEAIGPVLGGDPVSIVLGATLGFFAPAVVLSAIPPVVVKIRLASLDETGTVVGSYSAVGTAGAIVGTFVTGFVLLVAFPTRPIVTALGVMLVIVGLALWRRAARGKTAVVAVAIGLAGVLLAVDGPCDRETTYHCAVLAVDADRPTGRVLVLDGVRNSYVDMADPTHLEFRYVQVIADVIDGIAPPGPLRVVSIGGGAMTLPTYLAVTRPGTTNLVLEIDAPLVDLVDEEFGIDPSVTVVVGDARLSLADLPAARADVIIGDAFSGTSVPWHLTTAEYVREIGRALAADGIYVMNVIDFGEHRFARAAVATLQGEFAEVSVFAPGPYRTSSAGGNFVIVASDRRIDEGAVEAAIRGRGGLEEAWSDATLAAFVDGASRLTDDHAPVDQLLGSPR